jgi:hypothetical protein
MSLMNFAGIKLEEEPRARIWRTWVLVLVMVLVGGGGCALPRREPGAFPRPFEFGKDTFAYSNELFWVYQIDPQTGRTYHQWRQPPPTYAQHCYVVSRSARQFFQSARFDPTLPATDEPTYRRLVRAVTATNPRRERHATNQIVIPGFADLHAFSAAFEDLLKAECGSMWQSYFQRGHWRMIMPFSVRDRRRTLQELIASLRRNRPPIVHVTHFPRLQINHAMVVYDVTETAEAWEFHVYDPNFATTPSRLYFNKAREEFYFPPQSYFQGGIVDVYEIYHRWHY